MTNQTKTLIGIGLAAAAVYIVYTKMKKPATASFAAAESCTFYQGSVSQPNGFLINGWGSHGGVVVNNGASTGQTLICPVGQIRTFPSA